MLLFEAPAGETVMPRLSIPGSMMSAVIKPSTSITEPHFLTRSDKQSGKLSRMGQSMKNMNTLSTRASSKLNAVIDGKYLQLPLAYT
jgi:hypothetical protein